MFGWLRKSSKEPTSENKPQPNVHVLPQHIQPHYVHVDDRVQPKSLDQNFENMDDKKDFNNTNGIYTDKPHSVTAARPFFQAQQHLDQQQMKQELIQTNYMSDHEPNYDENNDNDNIPPNSPEHEPLPEPEPEPENHTKNTNSSSNDDILNISNNNDNNINNINTTTDIPQQPVKKNVIRSFQQRTNDNIIDIPTDNKMDEDEINHSMDSNTSKQSTDNMILNNISNESEKKSNQNNDRKRSQSNTKTRGFSKRESKTKLSQRRRSSGKKNRSFTPESVANIQTKTLPPTLSETNVQNNIIINPYETEKSKRQTQNEIVAKPAKQSEPEPAPISAPVSYIDKYNKVIIIRIENWLKVNNLYFPNNNKGEKLLIALLESGIENPMNDLVILSPYPDLHEIAAMAGLNILERRKFINAAHTKINEFQTVNASNASGSQQVSVEEKQNVIGVNGVSKKVVVMSTEEQQSLARIDCVIEQLKNTRNLIKKRKLNITNGGIEYEKIIRKEFEILRDLLRQREQQLIDEMKYKNVSKMTSLSDLDHDLLMVLEECQRSKLNAQKLMKTNEQPRVSRQKWRKLMGRKKKVIDTIETTIDQYILNHSNNTIKQLIITSMKMNEIMPSLPQPLMAQYMPSNNKIYAYPHHHRRHYDEINNYLLNIFTKNFEQIHLELTCAGYAFQYTERRKMHELMKEYGIITDVESQLDLQLISLFPSQFGGLSASEIVSQNKVGTSQKYTKSININLNKIKQIKENKIKEIKPESKGILPCNILYAKCILINPEDWEQQIRDNKKKRKNNNNKMDWKSYGNLHISIEMNEYEMNEWELINKKLKQIEEKRERKMKKLNRFSEDRFNAMDDWEEKEAFKLQKYFATIVGNENKKDVLITQRIKEIEIQIGMKRKNNAENNDNEMGWISLGWIDIQSIAVKNDELNENENKNEEKDLQIPEQYKTEFESDENKNNNNNEINSKNCKSLKIPFFFKKHFQELMTQTYLAHLELELMTEIESEFENKQILKEKLEAEVMKQLANDDLFEFNSRNVDEFEKKFIICVRGRIRDRINIKMTNMKLPKKPPNIVNKNKNIIIPFKKNQKNKNENEQKQNELFEEEEIDSKLTECNLIVFQSSFSIRKLVNFSLLRPTVLVLKERKNKLDSKYVNGFISIVGNESLQFIDPISGANAILSHELPQDVDSCGLIIDFIRLKHPTFNENETKINENKTTSNNNNEDEILISKLRNAGKKLAIIRVGGSIYNAENERILCGRLDIYNIFCNTWVNIGEINPKRENMATIMFYGRVCITGGNIKNNTFEPTNLCQEFSFSEKKWKNLKNMNKARFGHCMCTFDTKPTKLFVYGGQISISGEYTNSVEIYNPQKREWIEIKSNPSKYKRFGSSCCIWKNHGIIVIGGQCENNESTKHCELYNTNINQWNSNTNINDLNYDHGMFPSIWCDSDDNCIYVASQCTIVDNKNREMTKITYRVEMLDHPKNKWRIIKLNKNTFNVQNPYQIYKSSKVWNADPVRKTIGASIKISN